MKSAASFDDRAEPAQATPAGGVAKEVPHDGRASATPPPSAAPASTSHSGTTGSELDGFGAASGRALNTAGSSAPPGSDSTAATARLRVSEEQRRRLKRLSPATRYAIKQAFVEWVETAQANEYLPIRGWENFMPEVHHSALLDRILGGKKPLPVAPPTRHAYPDYEAVEGRG